MGKTRGILTVQDVEATVLRAAQANLVTAAAQRVLEACEQAGKQPPEQVRPSHCHLSPFRATRRNSSA